MHLFCSGALPLIGCTAPVLLAAGGCLGCRAQLRIEWFGVQPVVGPGGGIEGGRIVAQGTPTDIAANEASVTGRYLR